MKMCRYAMQKGMAVAVIGFVVAILGTTPASALTLDTVTGSWSDVVGGTNVGFYTVGNEEQVRWGDPASDQSGLGFTGKPPPPVDTAAAPDQGPQAPKPKKEEAAKRPRPVSRDKTKPAIILLSRPIND